MSQNQSNSAFPWTGIIPNSMARHFAGVCTKSAEDLTAMQKEWVETLGHARRGQAEQVEAEAKLGSDFATQVAAAKAVSDAGAAYERAVYHQLTGGPSVRSRQEDGLQLMSRMGGPRGRCPTAVRL